MGEGASGTAVSAFTERRSTIESVRHIRINRTRGGTSQGHQDEPAKTASSPAGVLLDWGKGLRLSVKIDHTGRFVNVIAEGRIVLQDILDYFDQLVVEGAMPNPKLFDATHAEPELSNDDMMVLGARVSTYAAFDPRGPVALIAHHYETKDLVRRCMNLGIARRPAMLFNSVPAARAWCLSLNRE